MFIRSDKTTENTPHVESLTEIKMISEEWTQIGQLNEKNRNIVNIKSKIYNKCKSTNNKIKLAMINCFRKTNTRSR